MHNVVQGGCAVEREIVEDRGGGVCVDADEFGEV